MIIPAVAATLFLSSLTLDYPFTVSLPGWLEWMLGFLLLFVSFTAIALWIWALALLSRLWDARRGIALQRFAAERGLVYSRYGFAPERQGILLAEGPNFTRPPHPRSFEFDPKRPSLFRANFALWQSAGSHSPPMQIAIAGYTGGKSDAKGPRSSFRYLEMSLPRMLPHIMIDARGNGSLRPTLPGAQRLGLEGDFDRYFTVYVPQGYERDALELLTPDVMVCLIDHGRHWDIEIVDDRAVVASSRFRRTSDRAEYTSMLYFSELIQKELGHQASSYSDPRAALPRSQVAAAGTRLRLRSALWGSAAFVAAACFMLAFPHVLGWFLDR